MGDIRPLLAVKARILVAPTTALHRIERLMRQEGLRARPRRRGLPKDGGQRRAVSPNILDRAFVASAPNQKWIADFTYIWTAQDIQAVAHTLNNRPRKLLGWKTPNEALNEYLESDQ
jgi:transposase InsO family protein